MRLLIAKIKRRFFCRMIEVHVKSIYYPARLEYYSLFFNKYAWEIVDPDLPAYVNVDEDGRPNEEELYAAAMKVKARKIEVIYNEFATRQIRKERRLESEDASGV